MRVARGVCLASACNACLVADPPQYDEPQRTPPFLDLVAAIPSPNRVIVRHRNINPLINFDVPVRSEDNGDPLVYALHRNYTFETASIALAWNEFPPGAFDEAGRSIQFPWTIKEEVGDGCHQLTLLVAHRSNWNLNQYRPDAIRGIGDTAMATWWLNVDPRADDPNSLFDCPNASEIQQ
jgi:hypothetical protein